MRKTIGAVLLVLCGTAGAQTAGLKPGLWDVKIIRQVIDGKDMSAQIASAQARMQEALAKMTPEQRAMMEGRLKGMMGQGAGGTTRICISPAMAAKNETWTDREGRCGSAKVSHSGNKTSFEVNCSSDGRTTVGSGDSTLNGDTVTTHVDLTTTDARGSHTVQSETQMRFVGADCEGVMPVDQMAKGMQGSSH
jgi:hypothetical protein